jgi:hypothetical protein
VRPRGTFIDVSSNCGVEASGTLTCWRFANPAEANPLAGKLVQLSSGYSENLLATSVCGLTNHGSIACWGNAGLGLDQVPIGSFRQVSNGGDDACAVLRSRKLVCWGREEQAVTNQIPTGSFTQVDVIADFACALKEGSGAVVCWSDELSRNAVIGGPFTQVSLGISRSLACAIRVGGKVLCWDIRDPKLLRKVPSRAVLADQRRNQLCLRN